MVRVGGEQVSEGTLGRHRFAGLRGLRACIIGRMSQESHAVLLVPSQFPTIQAAIDAVVRPSTVMVSPGIYAEDLIIVGSPAIVISSTRFGNRGVTLVGAANESVVRIEQASLYLSGVEIRSNGRSRAISALDSTIALQESALVGNRVGETHAEPSGAAMLCTGSAVRIQKSMIAGNSVCRSVGDASGGAFHLVDCKVEIAGASIQANAVYAGGRAQGGGIWAERGQMRMWRSRVTENAVFGAEGAGGGVYFKDASAQLGGSVITGNGSTDGRGGGIFVSGQRERVVVHRDTVIRRNHPDDFVVA